MDTLIKEEEFNEELTSRFNLSKKEAESIVNDEDKVEKILIRLESKLKKMPMLGEKLSVLPMLISLIRSYVKKEYREIPIGSIVAILGAIIYFVNPLDLILDTIPVIGYADDISLLYFIWPLIEDDVEEYKEWKTENQK